MADVFHRCYARLATPDRNGYDDTDILKHIKVKKRFMQLTMRSNIDVAKPSSSHIIAPFALCAYRYDRCRNGNDVLCKDNTACLCKNDTNHLRMLDDNHLLQRILHVEPHH